MEPVPPVVLTRAPGGRTIGLVRKAIKRLSGGRYGHRRRPNPRERLLQAMPARSVCAEIGVLAGDFSERILTVVQPARLHLVDPWRYETDERYERSVYGGPKGGSQADMDALYAAVCRRFAGPVTSGTVAIHRAASTDAAARIPDGSLDWVYIDANHQYEFVKADLETWAPKVRRGGFITGDDYGITGWWEGGVTRAVDEFVAAGRCGAVDTFGSQFILRKPA